MKTVDKEKLWEAYRKKPSQDGSVCTLDTMLIMMIL